MEIHPDCLENKLQQAAATEQHFKHLLSVQALRLSGSESCPGRFRSSVETLRQHPTGAALAAVDECHNELCVLKELLEHQDHPFSLVEYEPALPRGDHRRYSHEHSALACASCRHNQSRHPFRR